jgi:hypothetical protein
MGASKRRERVSLETALMPVGVGKRGLACRYQARYLLRGGLPAQAAQVLQELLLSARTDDERRYGHCIEAVDLEQVDVVGAEPTQAALDRLQEVEARRADVVGPRARGEGRLGGNQDLAAAAADRFTKHFLGLAAGVPVGRIEHRDTGVETDIHQARGFGGSRGAPASEEIPHSPEGCRAEGEHGNLETRATKQTVLYCCHAPNISRCSRRMQDVAAARCRSASAVRRKS